LTDLNLDLCPERRVYRPPDWCAQRDFSRDYLALEKFKNLWRQRRGGTCNGQPTPSAGHATTDGANSKIAVV
jgi:hypothetical protein